MIRRTFLKTLLASPLLGLFKSRKSGASTGLTVGKGADLIADWDGPHLTTGTSSEGVVLLRVYNKDEAVTVDELSFPKEGYVITSIDIQDGKVYCWGHV